MAKQSQQKVDEPRFDEHLGDVKAPTGKLASALIAYLVGSGTNPQKLAPFEAWSKEQGENLPAEALFKRFEEAGISQGTLLKAGKWVYGPTYRIEAATSQTAEALQLRGELDQLNARLQTTVSERNGYMNRVAYLEGAMEKLQQELQWAKMGRPAMDNPGIQKPA